ncbi:MAG: sigma-70 family RNA polymerase sigma factor [Planctomycetota bacterium]
MPFSDPSQPPTTASPPFGNDTWLAALTGGGVAAAAATEALRRTLRGALERAFGDRGAGLDLEETTQEAVLQVLKSLERFRGDSSFTTWAIAVATRTAFTELRRRKVREGRTVPFAEVVEQAARFGDERAVDPAASAGNRQLFAALEQAIATALTERQRTAILAELRGVPTIEVAAQLGTNQNALYKLVHDARRNLRRELERRGFDATALHDLAAGGASA